MLQKLLPKEQFKKTAEATGDLIGNKIADKVTSIGKPKEKEKEKTKKIWEIYIPLLRLLILDCFKYKFYFF